MHNSLKDLDNFDFRPIKNSVYLAKGIGSYGKESVSSGSCSHDSSHGGVLLDPWISTAASQHAHTS